MKIILGFFLPFIGTIIGASLVFFMRKRFSDTNKNILLAISAGIMMAASIWSLLLPALEMTSNVFLVVFGIVIGVLFLQMINNYQTNTPKLSKMILAITLHNIPEGMAVGVCLAGLLAGNSSITIISFLMLSLGIAIQNIPEGAIISMPLKEFGLSKKMAFIIGVLSGIVEPIFAGITLLLTGIIVPVLPLLFGFAAGAMIYVIVDELVPEASVYKYSPVFFSLGFLIMMILDVIFG